MAWILNVKYVYMKGLTCSEAENFDYNISNPELGRQREFHFISLKVLQFSFVVMSLSACLEEVANSQRSPFWHSKSQKYKVNVACKRKHESLISSSDLFESLHLFSRCIGIQSSIGLVLLTSYAQALNNCVKCLIFDIVET